MSPIGISIVLFKTNEVQLVNCLNSIFNCKYDTQVFIIDNSPFDVLSTACRNFKNLEYIHNPSNPGYGSAHNIAILKSIKEKYDYHIVINPDIYFSEGCIEGLLDYMKINLDVGLIMPKVLFPNGDIQYLCKLIPTPFDLLVRAFFPRSYFQKSRDNFELRWTGYNKIMSVPYLSGCFMLLRVDTLKEVGLFDESFFMYPEDIDLSRRIAASWKTIYYPFSSVFHEYGALSKKSYKLLLIHTWNIIKYFNKWGWFFDKNRSEINDRALKNILHNYDK